MNKPRRFFLYLLLIATLLTGFILNAEGNIIIIGELTHEYEIKTGTEISGTIEVSNVDPEPHEVKVYQTDYQFFADGKVLYGEPGKLPHSNAGWITVTPKYFTVPGNESMTIYYTVKAPDDQTLKGTYNSIIMVEGITKNSPESSTADTETALGVSQVFRYGIQMVTHIGITGTKSLKFTSAKLLKAENQFQLDVENTGERWLRPVLWAELYDPKGAFKGKYEGGKLRIYPGSSVRFVLDLSTVEPGKYKALVVADCGSNDVFGANWNLILE